MTDPPASDGRTDDRERRSRAHIFSGGAACVLAVGAVPLFGWLAGLAMALLAAGNLLAARSVRRAGGVAPAAWALMAVGGIGFVAACLVRAFVV